MNLEQWCFWHSLNCRAVTGRPRRGITTKTFILAGYHVSPSFLDSKTYTVLAESLLTFRGSVALFQIFSIRFCSWTGNILIDRAIFWLVWNEVCYEGFLHHVKFVIWFSYFETRLIKETCPFLLIWRHLPPQNQANLKPRHQTESKEYKMAIIFAVKFCEGDEVTMLMLFP